MAINTQTIRMMVLAGACTLSTWPCFSVSDAGIIMQRNDQENFFKRPDHISAQP